MARGDRATSGVADSFVMRRILNSAWFLPSIGVAVGGLALVGLTLDGLPTSLRWVSKAVVALAVVAPALPFLALLPRHFLAVRRGLIPRSHVPRAVTVAHGTVIVDHGSSQTRCDLHEVSRARRARNDNWTESKMLEDALGLFSSQGREFVRVPVAVVGVDALVHELNERGVPIDDVLVSAPAFLD